EDAAIGHRPLAGEFLDVPEIRPARGLRSAIGKCGLAERHAKRAEDRADRKFLADVLRHALEVGGVVVLVVGGARSCSASSVLWALAPMLMMSIVGCPYGPSPRTRSALKPVSSTTWMPVFLVKGSKRLFLSPSCVGPPIPT